MKTKPDGTPFHNPRSQMNKDALQRFGHWWEQRRAERADELSTQSAESQDIPKAA